MLLKNTWACILSSSHFSITNSFLFYFTKVSLHDGLEKEKKKSFAIKFKKHCIRLLKQGEMFTVYN